MENNQFTALLLSLETERTAQSKQIYTLTFAAWGALLLALAFAFVPKNAPASLGYLSLPGAIFGLGFAIWAFRKRLERRELFMQTFRGQLLKSIIQQTFPQTEYKQAYIAKEQFEKAQFGDDFNRYEGEDWIKTQIKNCGVELCQLSAKYFAHKSSWVVFNGEFAVLTPAANHLFSLATPLLLDYQQPYAASITKAMSAEIAPNKAAKENVPNFSQSPLDKLYHCYAEDSSKVQQVLTPAFLAWLEQQKGKFSFHIFPHSIYVGWHSELKSALFNQQPERDFLSVDIHQPLTEAVVKKLMGEIRQKFTFIEQLLDFFPLVTNQ